jgi:signal peptidase I
MEIETKQVHVQKEESVWDLIRFALVVFVIAMGIRFFVAQPFVVSGTSMVPTFADKNYLIIDELTYHFRSPERGEVIVFHPPGQPKGIYYIKRVIGLPNETISIDGGTVTIINKDHPNGFILTEPYISAPTNNQITKTLAADEFFVMGDNRPFSSDSRTWGTLPEGNIVGRAFLRLFPLKSINVLPGAHSDYSVQ